MLARGPYRLSSYGRALLVPCRLATTKSRSRFVISKDGIIRELPPRHKIPKSFENPLETVPVAVRRALTESPKNMTAALTAVSALVNKGSSSPAETETAYKLYFEISRAFFSHKDPLRSQAKLLSILEAMKAHGLPADEAFFVKLFELVSKDVVNSTVLSLFSYMKLSGVKATSMTALFFMRRFSQASNYTRAFEIFDVIRSDPSFALDADVLAELIYAGIMSKDSSLAERAFEEVRFYGIAPNASCYGQLARATAESKEISHFQTRYLQLHALSPPGKESYRRMLISALGAHEWGLFTQIISSTHFKAILEPPASQRAKPQLGTSQSLPAAGQEQLIAPPSQTTQHKPPLPEALSSSNVPFSDSSSSDHDQSNDIGMKTSDRMNVIDMYRKSGSVSELNRAIDVSRSCKDTDRDRLYEKLMEATLAANDDHFAIFLDHLQKSSYRAPHTMFITLVNICESLKKPTSVLLDHLTSLEQKTGQWFNSPSMYARLIRRASTTGVNDDFIRVLEIIDSRGVVMEPRLFLDTVARSLIASGFLEEAHQLLDELRSLGVQPMTGAYTKLTIMYANRGKVDKAIQTYLATRELANNAPLMSVGHVLAALAKLASSSQVNESYIDVARQLCSDAVLLPVLPKADAMEPLINYFREHGESDCAQSLWNRVKEERSRRLAHA